jgi:catechol 2,3-dioxygenase-like lactoylglutathione lyase family enzyme
VSADVRRSESTRRRPNTQAAFEQNRVGLHHLCFRVRERADVDELHRFLCSLGVPIVRAPREDQWAPGYYSLLFEDPDGIRLELNHVPGKGLLD